MSITLYLSKSDLTNFLHSFVSDIFLILSSPDFSLNNKLECFDCFNTLIEFQNLEMIKYFSRYYQIIFSLINQIEYLNIDEEDLINLCGEICNSISYFIDFNLIENLNEINYLLQFISNSKKMTLRCIIDVIKLLKKIIFFNDLNITQNLINLIQEASESNYEEISNDSKKLLEIIF